MVMSRLDPSPWNLGVPLALLTACGPLVPFDDSSTDTGSTTTDGSGPNPTSPNPTGPNPTGPNPTSATTSTVQCYLDSDCPQGYECRYNLCYYTGYCDDGCCDGTCCSPECGWYYECFSNLDCPEGQACRYNECQPADNELECGIVSLEFQIPIATEEGVLSLAFLDADGDTQRDLAIGRTDGVDLVSGVNLGVTPVADSVYALDVVAGDLDGDGDGDLAVIDAADILVNVYINDGAWSAVTLDNSQQDFGELALADIDGDLVLDLYGRSENNGTFVAFNSPPGVFSQMDYVFDAATSIAIGRVDDDGLADAVLWAWSGYVLRDGPAFSPWGLADNTTRDRKTVAIGNYNGSGDDDILAIQAIGNGSLVSSWTSSVFDYVAYNSWWSFTVDEAVSVDMNGDGYVDVVGAAYGNPLTIAFGGPTKPPDAIDCVQYVELPIPPETIAVGDLTGDGRPDVAITDGVSLIVLAQGG